MQMWKYFFYPLMLLLVWHSNNLLADETEQTLYVNVLDPNSNFEQSLLNAMYKLKDEASGISLQPISPAGFAEKAYKLTRNITTKDNTNIKEEYILRLFNNTTLQNKYYEVDIEASPIYNTDFSNYLYIKITDKTQSNVVKEGMLPVINKESLLLLQDKPYYMRIDDKNKPKTVTEKTLLAMNQLFDIARSVAKQLSLHESINNPIILNTFTERNITLLEIPDNTLFNTILYETHHDIKKLLTHMYKITEAVEILHQKNIVIGEIKLTNLFTLKDRMVLLGFESFIRNDIKASENTKIIIDDFNGCAPEIKTPMCLGGLFYITNLTFCSDIYSLGMLFYGLLYIFALDKSNNRSDLKSHDDIYTYIDSQKYKLSCFNRYPYQLTSKLAHGFSFSGSFCLYYKTKDIFGYYFRKLKQDSTEVIQKLIDIINQCNQPNPASRPTATEVKNMLQELLVY